MDKKTRKRIRKAATFALVMAVLFWLVPWVAAIWLVCGLVDYARNKPKTAMLTERYFAGNGLLTWLLSPFNLLVDLISKRNPGVYRLEDFPPEWREEIEGVLAIFDERKDEIIADIDAQFPEGRRGMYVYQWYGKQGIDKIPAFNRDYKYVKTIAVSVFSGAESTTWHFGPLRVTTRVLYNLKPADSDRVFIETQGVKNVWRDSPLFIFDDTLFHRSVNEVETRRYNVFMDVTRPTPFPGVLNVLVDGVAVIAEQMKGAFYKNWKMVGGKEKAKTA